MSKKKYWSGQECPETANYGQYHDPDDAYAGSGFDRYVTKGSTFPPFEKQSSFCEEVEQKQAGISRRYRLVLIEQYEKSDPDGRIQLGKPWS